MPKLLLVEDDQDLTRHLRQSLTDDHYIVETVSSGEEALQLLTNFGFDIIVLDWSLEDLTGIDVCRRYRASGGLAPVLFLTGHSRLEDKENGLDSGADDYLTKPFEYRELAARLRSLLRRNQSTVMIDLSANGVSLDIGTRIITAADKKVRLSHRECALMEYFLRHQDRTYSAKALLDSVWPASSEVSEETVRTCMKTLRHKLTTIGHGELIKTVLGSGYIIERS